MNRLSKMLKNKSKKPASKRKIPATIYLTEEQQYLLKELSDRSKVPAAEYVRQGVNLILHKNRLRLPGQLSFLLEPPPLKRTPPLKTAGDKTKSI